MDIGIEKCTQESNAQHLDKNHVVIALVRPGMDLDPSRFSDGSITAYPATGPTAQPSLVGCVT